MDEINTGVRGSRWTALRKALALTLASALVVITAPVAADRAPAANAVPVPVAAAAVVAGAIPAFKPTAAHLDAQTRRQMEAQESGPTEQRELREEPAQAAPADRAFGPPMRAARFGDPLPFEASWHVAVLRRTPFAPDPTPVAGHAGERWMTAGLGTSSGGATHLDDAPRLARARRPAGTIAPAPASAAPVEEGSVPEPGTWAMLLAGLLGAGAIVRRRASR
jgi:hypothetical protein